jgi:hypothetical protein
MAGRFNQVMPRIALALGAFLLAGCTPLGLNTASSNFSREEQAHPGVLDALAASPEIATRADWSDRRLAELREAFETNIYGPVPSELKGVATARRVVDADYANGAGTLEEIDVLVGDAPGVPFRIALALPKGASMEKPAPLILGENFCGNPGTTGSDKLSPPMAGGACENTGMMARVIRLIFGVYIIESPNELILSRGYGYANVFPSELVADGAGPEQAAADLKRFEALLPAERRPQSAIGVWAAGFGWALDVLDQDPRIDAKRTAVYGHSRHGKAALLAAAFDPRIEATISHQSGKGGATLTRSYAGESVKQITNSYPHWFAPAYLAFGDREAAIPVDQHQLIAMVAPRPILLGNGWKDVWSDPNGSFRAALGADPVYRLMGADGMTQKRMSEDWEEGEIDFYIRPGGHGVRKVDWDHFLDFLDRCFGAD